MKTPSETAILLDTNVLVYAHDRLSPNYAASRQLLEVSQDDPGRFYLAPQVLFEFFAVLTHPKRTRQPRAAAEVLDVMEQLSELFTVIQPPEDIHYQVSQLVREMGIASKNIYDVVLAATMLANGINRIYTYDDDFTRIPGIIVLEP